MGFGYRNGRWSLVRRAWPTLTREFRVPRVRFVYAVKSTISKYSEETRCLSLSEVFLPSVYYLRRYSSVPRSYLPLSNSGPPCWYGLGFLFSFVRNSLFQSHLHTLLYALLTNKPHDFFTLLSSSHGAVALYRDLFDPPLLDPPILHPSCHHSDPRYQA